MLGLIFGASISNSTTMRNTTILLALASLLIFTGCRVESGPEPKTTIGSDYQVMVICDDDIWDGDLAMAVCDLLETDIPGLVRPEGYFNIVKQVAPQNATDMDKRYGIIFKVELSAASTEPKYSVTNDLYARPQIILTLTAANIEQAVGFIYSHADELREVMNESERNEAIKAAYGKPAQQLMNDFSKSTGHKMLIPHSFFKANPADEELTWYIRDYPNKAQYIYAFTTDYDPEVSIEDESATIVSAINNKFNTISSKGADGSYMQISPYREIVADVLNINGTPMLELRGCWEVENDYMGGSFTAYTIFDAETSRATVVIFAIYAPEDSQRNLMRELECLIYTLE